MLRDWDVVDNLDLLIYRNLFSSKQRSKLKKLGFDRRYIVNYSARVSHLASEFHSKGVENTTSRMIRELRRFGYQANSFRGIHNGNYLINETQFTCKKENRILCNVFFDNIFYGDVSTLHEFGELKHKYRIRTLRKKNHEIKSIYIKMSQVLYVDLRNRLRAYSIYNPIN